MVHEKRVCCEHLKQCVRLLDSAIFYSRRLDGHNGLQEIAEVAKTLIQLQIKDCEHCERNQRHTAQAKRPVDDPHEIFLDHIPRRA